MITKAKPPKAKPPKAKPPENEAPKVEKKVLDWNMEDLPEINYPKLGQRLADCGDLYRSPDYAGGLLLVLNGGDHRKVTTALALARVIEDRVPVQVYKDGKPKGGGIPNTQLNRMLGVELFLNCFRPVDIITSLPLFLANFTLTRPGINEGGEGQWIFYTGDSPTSVDSMEAVNKFLNVMEFDTDASRTNALAAALTVLLRNHFPGGKPILIMTSTKSQSGKDTVLAFAANEVESTSISYGGKDWALEHKFIRAVKNNPASGLIVLENARLDGREKFIASAFLERFVTDPRPFLSSPGTGEPFRMRNTIVTAISTNYGIVSEDEANRGLPSHLNPVGDVADRKPDIGNPKEEFLPKNKYQIAAELRGMVVRWVEAGMPMDEDVRHPFSLWAKTIGGILKFNGFKDFLANYRQRKTLDDPVRRGLAILGAAKPEVWLKPEEWARLAVQLGVDKAVIPVADQGSGAGQARGIGVVFHAHRDETFETETETHKLRLGLEKRRGRWGGGSSGVRYRFTSLSTEELPLDDAEEGAK